MAAIAPPATTGSPAPRGPLPLTPGRVTALLIGVPVALGLVALAAFSLLAPFAGGRYHVSYTAPASTRSLTVNSNGGQLSVQPTAADRVTLNGTARYSFIRSTFSAKSTGGNTAMNYHCAPLPSSNCGLDATIGVPAGLPVNVSTDGGNVSVTRISAPVTLHSAGGDLSADHVTGPVNLSTDGGNIRLNAVTAPVTASTMGGDVDLADVGSHTVTIHTSGGNIRASGVTAQNVTASTSGGDIDIVFTSVPASVDVGTSGGNITLVLPSGSTQYDVNAHTDGGIVSDGLVPNSASGHRITATTGGGDIILRQEPVTQQ
jgi:hypothetical protein